MCVFRHAITFFFVNLLILHGPQSAEASTERPFQRGDTIKVILPPKINSAMNFS